MAKKILNVINIGANVLVAIAGSLFITQGLDLRTGIIGSYVLYDTWTLMLLNISSCSIFGVLAAIMETFHISFFEKYFLFYWLALGRAAYFVL